MDTTNRAPYFILWIGCIFGSLALMPFLYFARLLPPTVSLETMTMLIVAQSTIMSGLALWISYKIIPKTDLHPFSLEQPWANIIVPGVCYGALASLLIVALDKGFFAGSDLHDVQHPPIWSGVLASFYGAINEEVLCRVFLLSGIYYLLAKTGKNRTMLLWLSTIVAALVFGMAHLPAASKLVQLTSVETAHIILLNAVPGVIFGWLYWSRSFFTAALAHFTADIFLHAIL